MDLAVSTSRLRLVALCEPIGESVSVQLKGGNDRTLILLRLHVRQPVLVLLCARRIPIVPDRSC